MLHTNELALFVLIAAFQLMDIFLIIHICKYAGGIISLLFFLLKYWLTLKNIQYSSVPAQKRILLKMRPKVRARTEMVYKSTFQHLTINFLHSTIKDNI